MREIHWNDEIAQVVCAKYRSLFSMRGCADARGVYIKGKIRGDIPAIVLAHELAHVRLKHFLGNARTSKAAFQREVDAWGAAARLWTGDKGVFMKVVEAALDSYVWKGT